MWSWLAVDSDLSEEESFRNVRDRGFEEHLERVLSVGERRRIATIGARNRRIDGVFIPAMQWFPDVDADPNW